MGLVGEGGDFDERDMKEMKMEFHERKKEKEKKSDEEEF